MPRALRIQYPGNEIGIRRLDDEVKMITHETIRMNLPVGFLADFSQCGEKLLVIEIIAEDRFTAVTTVHHMVDRAGILDAQRAGHVAVLPPQLNCVNSED